MNESEPRLIVFKTGVGWIGVMHCDRVLHRVRIGFETMLDAAMAFKEHCVGPNEPNTWEKKLIRRITKCLSNSAGRKVEERDAYSFDDIQLDDGELTNFQRKVVNACRNLAFGETASYGELAKRVGHPGAARAVGTVMSRNRFPIIVPCHRVLSSSGIGGFSSPRGLATKRDLLEIEGHEFSK